ncbi:hypothetical protein MMPV_006558 [Pyropia vietnamensis]
MDDDYSDGVGGDDYDDVGAGWDSDGGLPPPAGEAAAASTAPPTAGSPVPVGALAGLADDILDIPLRPASGSAAAPLATTATASATAATVAASAAGGAAARVGTPPSAPGTVPSAAAAAPTVLHDPAVSALAGPPWAPARTLAKPCPSSLALLLGDDPDDSSSNSSDGSGHDRWGGGGDGSSGDGRGNVVPVGVGGVGGVGETGVSGSPLPCLDLRFPSGLPGATAAYLFAFDEPSPDQRAAALANGAPSSVVLPKKAVGPMGKSGLGPAARAGGHGRRGEVDDAAAGIDTMRLGGGGPRPGARPRLGATVPPHEEGGGPQRAAPPLTAAGKGVRQRTRRLNVAALVRDDPSRPSVVVFVGASGGGKSTLVGSLLVGLGVAAPPKGAPGSRRGGGGGGAGGGGGCGGGEQGTQPPSLASKKKKHSARRGGAQGHPVDGPSPSWLLDEEAVERRHGRSVDVGFRTVTAPASGEMLLLLDAPGHPDFGPSLAVAAAQASAAVLVVDGRDGAAEAVLDGVPGSTAEHAALLRALGVTHVVVAVNGLDAVAAPAARYNQVVAAVRPLLARVGFAVVAPAPPAATDRTAVPAVTFVPCSALSGANVVAVTADHDAAFPWHMGPSLVAAIERLPAVRDSVDAAAGSASRHPTRLLVYDCTRSAALGALTVRVRVAAGSVAPGDRLLAAPSNQVLTVKAVEDGVGRRIKGGAVAGHAGLVNLGLSGGVAGLALSSAFVLGDPAAPPVVATRFAATLLLTASAPVLLPGARAVMVLGNAAVAVVIARLLGGPRGDGAADVTTAAAGDGAATPVTAASGGPQRPTPRPRMLVAGQSAAVVIHTTESPVVLETYAALKALGRFTLRVGVRMVGAGVVTSVLPSKRLRSQLAGGAWRPVVDGEAGAAESGGGDGTPVASTTVGASPMATD